MHTSFFLNYQIEKGKVHDVLNQTETFLCFNWISIHKKINNRLTMSTRWFWSLLTAYFPVESPFFGGQPGPL